MRKYLSIILITLVLVLITSFISQVKAFPAAAPDYSSASELIDAVNNLRAERGLFPYTVNSILMGIAQTQAEYIASIGFSTAHLDAYGRSPYQRALDAGYAVAGDLTLGGFFSENVVGGISLSAEGAVEIWMGDAPHQGTMLSTNLQDVGAGVAVSYNTYYYVLDAGLSTGGTPKAYTPAPYYIINTPILATNTPGTDGAIIYIVQPNDTLLGIAIAYDTTLNALYALNGLTENSLIYAGQPIIVRAAFTPTSTLPTSTPTIRPSSTPWPTSSSTVPVTDIAPTTTKAPVLPSTSAGGAVIAIVVAALLGAAFLTMAGSRKKTEEK
jgi:uncharacterized protein YkwD